MGLNQEENIRIRKILEEIFKVGEIVENVFKKIIAKNFPILGKDLDT